MSGHWPPTETMPNNTKNMKEMTNIACFDLEDRRVFSEAAVRDKEALRCAVFKAKIKKVQNGWDSNPNSNFLQISTLLLRCYCDCCATTRRERSLSRSLARSLAQMFDKGSSQNTMLFTICASAGGVVIMAIVAFLGIKMYSSKVSPKSNQHSEAQAHQVGDSGHPNRLQALV